VISSSGSSRLRRLAAEEGIGIGMGEEGGEPIPLHLTLVYLIIIQIIPLVFVFHLSYQIFCLILALGECQVARVKYNG
jgi:hypothetical protein